MTVASDPVGVAIPPQAPAEPAAAVAVPAAHGHAEAKPEPDGRFRVYVWQIPVRITHWVTATAIVVLSITGGYIADPFIIPPGGSVMTNVRFIHIVFAIVLVVSGLVRAIYLLVGNRYARWSAFIPTTMRQATEILRQAGFYAFIVKEIPRIIGHNQLAAAAYLGLWLLLLLETLTGFALDGLLGSEPGATALWWPRAIFGPQLIRMVHHAAMYLILAIALFHVYSSVLVDSLERNGLLASIFSGYKYMTREEIVLARDGDEGVADEAERMG